jgi:hypothetical protein
MASILDTFLILFESNADEVDKGSKQAEKSTKSLNDSLKSTDGAIKGVGEGFVGLIAGAAGALTAALSVGAVVSSVMAAADTNDKLNDFTERLGLNIEEVNAWGDAVALNGGTAEGFQGTIDSLTESLNMFAVKGTSRNAAFFKELGVEMVDAKGKARDVMEVLPELADAFQGLTRQESSGMGRKLGLDQGTIALLQQGRREVEAQIARQKELGTVTKEDAEIAAKFNDTYDDTSKVFRSLFTTLGSSILPVFTQILTGIQSIGVFMREHSDFIVGLLIAIGSAVAFYVLPPLISMAAAVVVAFAPFLLMGAIVAGVAVAFALLYDDIMNFIDGNDSLIGQILTAFPMIGDVIQSLIGYIEGLWSAVSWVFESIASLIQISYEGWKQLFDLILGGISSFVSDSASMQQAIGFISEAFETMRNVVGGVWDYLGSRVESFMTIVRAAIGLVKSVAGGISGALDSVKSGLGIGGLAQGKEALATAGASPINAVNSNSIANSAMTSSKSTSVQTGNITIQTQATDAEGIAGAIGTTLGAQMQQTATTFDDGVQA